MIESERPPNKDGLVNHIRRLRFEQNEMTQQELATRVSVTRQTIVALESGRYSPSLPLAIRICRVFGKPVEEVFQLHVPKPMGGMQQQAQSNSLSSNQH